MCMCVCVCVCVRVCVRARACVYARARVCVCTRACVCVCTRARARANALTLRYEETPNNGATPSNQTREYEEIVRMVYEKDRTTVDVDFKHILNFDQELADRIQVENSFCRIHFLCIKHISLSYDMYPPPHVTCIILI